MTVHFWVSVCQRSLTRFSAVSLSLSSLQKERRLLQNRRLDLDACKARLKKAKAAEAKATVSGPARSLLPGSAGEFRDQVFACWGWTVLTGQVMVSVPTPGNPGGSRTDMYEVGRLTGPVTGLGTLQACLSWLGGC